MTTTSKQAKMTEIREKQAKYGDFQAKYMAKKVEQYYLPEDSKPIEAFLFLVNLLFAPGTQYKIGSLYLNQLQHRLERKATPGKFDLYVNATRIAALFDDCPCNTQSRFLDEWLDMNHSKHILNTLEVTKEDILCLGAGGAEAAFQTRKMVEGVAVPTFYTYTLENGDVCVSFARYFNHPKSWFKTNHPFDPLPEHAERFEQLREECEWAALDAITPFFSEGFWKAIQLAEAAEHE